MGPAGQGQRKGERVLASVGLHGHCEERKPCPPGCLPEERGARSHARTLRPGPPAVVDSKQDGHLDTLDSALWLVRAGTLTKSPAFSQPQDPRRPRVRRDLQESFRSGSPIKDVVGCCPSKEGSQSGEVSYGEKQRPL